MASRWLIVSNRLPVKWSHGKLGPSSGGLVTALMGIHNDQEKLWIGAASDQIPRQAFKEQRSRGEIGFVPLYLEDELYAHYYNGFCNDVIWPLFHYEVPHVKYEKENWEAYVEVNKRFAELVAKTARASDLIWVHDFHLFLVPYFLKQKKPSLKVGFFLHIPFPTSEIFRQLPVAKDLMEGVLCSDLVGLHDYSYLRHFVSTAKVVLGAESSQLTIEHHHHSAQLGVFPASIDSKQFAKRAATAKVGQIQNHYRQSAGTRYIILGVDRLDYIKGIDLKLKIFQKLLRENPSLVGHVQLIQLTIPSRMEVPEYRALKEKVDQLVGEINGEFGRADYVPIKYIFNQVTPQELSALYTMANVLLVTSKRDGMNLVALEYIVSQQGKDPGVLVLSEFAGAVSTLGHVLTINPFDVEKTASILYQALTMKKSDRMKRHRPMNEYLMEYTATVWAKTFIRDLASSLGPRPGTLEILNNRRRSLPKEVRDELKKARRRVLFIDFDGTLSPITPRPDQASVSQDNLQVLKSFSEQENMEVVVVSGRERKFLEAQFRDLPIHLAAEHGATYFHGERRRWRKLSPLARGDWYDSALKVMSDFVRRVPGSFVEKKDYAMVWHYRAAPRDLGDYLARKLLVELEAILANEPVSIIPGKKIVEVRSIAANKANFMKWFLEQTKDEGDPLVLAIGDDTTDEDMFRELQNKRAITVKVGSDETHARYRLASQDQVAHLLTEFKKAWA